MKHILSIDFDIIMEPSIEFYNRMTKIPWDIRANGNNYVNLLVANYDIYYDLTQYLLSLTDKIPANKIHFIYEHHHLVHFLDPKESYVVTNIDHHHDRGYPQDGYEKIYEQPLNCGNWINYVPNLKRYLWVNNPNSDIFIEDDEHSVVDGICFRDFNINNLTTPDEVFICFSIPWIPPTHQSLFYLWMDVLNKIYNTHFDFEVP